MNRTTMLRWSILVLLCAGVLGGCGWFHHRPDYYTKATEARPLDVPPDLDTPVASNELVVPAAPTSAPAAAATPTPENASPPTAGASSLAASGASSVLTGEGLRVADAPDHVWQRVGLALERAQVGTISARDASARSYTLEVSGLGAAPAPAQEHHWYSRILHPFGGGNKTTAQTVSGHLTVLVSPDQDGARVSVEGDSSDSATAAAARRVLEVLRERLS